MGRRQTTAGARGSMMKRRTKGNAGPEGGAPSGADRYRKPSKRDEPTSRKSFYLKAGLLLSLLAAALVYFSSVASSSSRTSDPRYVQDLPAPGRPDPPKVPKGECRRPKEKCRDQIVDIDPPSDYVPPKTKGKVRLGIVMKTRRPVAIYDWLRHHQKLGVERVYLRIEETPGLAEKLREASEFSGFLSISEEQSKMSLEKCRETGWAKKFQFYCDSIEAFLSDPGSDNEDVWMRYKLRENRKPGTLR